MLIPRLFSPKKSIRHKNIWSCNWSHIFVFLKWLNSSVWLVLKSAPFRPQLKTNFWKIAFTVRNWKLKWLNGNQDGFAKDKSVAASFFKQMIFTFCLHAPIPLKIGKRHHGKLCRVCSRCRRRQRDWRCRWYKKIGSFFLWIYCKSSAIYLKIYFSFQAWRRQWVVLDIVETLSCPAVIGRIYNSHMHEDKTLPTSTVTLTDVHGLHRAQSR